MFSSRNKKDISTFQMKKAPYLLLCYTIDTFIWLFVLWIHLYFGCQYSIIEKSPREASKMGGYALDLYKQIGRRD